MLLVKPRPAALALAVLAVVLVGCAERKKISEINADPGRYRNNDVTIAGTVTESYGALGMGAYQIDDGTGHMWVLSERSGVPGKGSRVAVTGRIIEGATFGGRSFGTALREGKRKT
jgi:hypothetical protein